MRLTLVSDYALRLLMLAHADHPRLVTIEETAASYDISRAHMMKVANILTRGGILTAVRGRMGGLRLARPPDQIRLGDVLRLTEPDFALVACQGGGACAIAPGCRLPPILAAGLAAFFQVLDQYTLADLAGSATPLLDAAPHQMPGQRTAE